jgi:Resolvase, N terminal domain
VPKRLSVAGSGTSDTNRTVKSESPEPTKKARSAHATSPGRRGRPTRRKGARAIPVPRPGEDGSSKGMLLGYARVSTIDQNLALQRDALAEAGCGRIFTEQLSGAVRDRPALCEALAFARSGDTLIVWKLDRLARSMKQLIETIEELRLKGIGFRSLTEALDTTTAQGRLVFHMFGALAEFERSRSHICVSRVTGFTENAAPARAARWWSSATGP